MKASDALTTALFRDSRSAICNAMRTVPAFTDAVLEICTPAPNICFKTHVPQRLADGNCDPVLTEIY
jgi:hypothetical protein